MMSQVLDEMGRPLGIQELIDDRIEYRGIIPLDITTGAKLALLFRLHPRVNSQKRIELMAWRIERFSREEALYWVSKDEHPGLWAAQCRVGEIRPAADAGRTAEGRR